MDESWRVPIGSVVPRRRSTEQMRRAGGGSLGADDFCDVFGGPPRSVLRRQFSGEQPAFPCSSASYFLGPHPARNGKEHWLRPPRGDPGQHGGKGSRTAAGGGRWVARTEEGFYDDIFESCGGEGGRNMSRARSWQSTSNSKSKPNSSSVTSSEDGGDSVDRAQAPVVDDAGLSFFVSRLRPIIVPSRRRGSLPSPTIVSTGEQSSSWKASTAPCAGPRFMESHFELQGTLSRHPALKVDGDTYNRAFRSHSSPPDHAAVWLEPEKAGAGEDHSGSSTPSSGVSSIYDDIPMATIMPLGRARERLALQELEKEVTVALEDEVEVESYGTIEIAPGGKATVDSVGAGAVDEAIAWAMEKFWAASSSREETWVGDDEHKQRSEMEEEEEELEHVNTIDGVPGRRYEGMLDVVAHLERFRGVWR